MFCEGCGKVVGDDDRFCGECGRPVAPRASAQNPTTASARPTESSGSAFPMPGPAATATAPTLVGGYAEGSSSSAQPRPSPASSGSATTSTPPPPPSGARSARETTSAGPSRSSGFSNFYKALNLASTASAEEIKKAIHRELRIWSNRTNAPQIERRQEAERKVKLLEEAESTLLNPSKRAEYDRKLSSAPTEERQIDEADLSGTEDLVQEGWRLLIAGNIADALYVATRATERQGNNSEAWALLAQAKFRWGEIEDAIYEYKRAVKLRPNEASYYFDLGTVYESTERWNDALQHYQRAAQIDPSSTMYRAAIGILFVKNERFQDGINLLEQCVQKEPDNETYQWFLAAAYHDGTVTSWWKNPENGQYYCISKSQADEAQRIITKAKALKFDDPELRANIAKTEELINQLYIRQFKGSWAFVIIFGFFYIIPGVLWWIVNRRRGYKINKDIHDIVEMGKADALVGGEVGAYYSALPPGLKWAAHSLPRYGVWILILICSPITFFYLLYDNYLSES